MAPFCYLNGEIVPVAEAKVGVYDIGILRGYGIYEALRTFNRIPFEFEAHMERFHRSTDALNLRIPIADDEIRRVVEELVSRNIGEGKDAVVRFIVTGGEAIGGIEYNPAAPTFTSLSKSSCRCRKICC